MKEFGSKKNNKMTALISKTIFRGFLYRVYAYAIRVPSWADQLLPQLLIERFDALHLQCGHIGHMHEGVWSKNLLLTKLQQYELRQFFL